MSNPRPAFEICILAGGASSRMGKDKAGLRFGRRTMLGLIRSEAEQLGARVRVIRKDLVERCGPLGGLFTGLKTTKESAVLFLACDMPLITAEFLATVVSHMEDPSRSAVFVQSKGIGFPLALRMEVLPVIEEQIANGTLSIHQLCKRLQGSMVITPNPAEAAQLFNVNSPEDFAIVKETMAARVANS